MATTWLCLMSLVGLACASTHLLEDVTTLLSDFETLSSNDKQLDSRLAYLGDVTAASSSQADTLANYWIPSLLHDIEHQDRTIRQLERKAEKLLALTDKIEVLTSTVTSLEQQLLDGQAMLQEQEEAVGDLQDSVTQTLTRDIPEVTDKLNMTETFLQKAYTDCSLVKAEIDRMKAVLRDVFDAVNTEDSETKYFQLTQFQPEQSIIIPSRFGGRRPSLQWGITSMQANHRHVPSFSANSTADEPHLDDNGDSDDIGDHEIDVELPAACIHWDSEVNFDRKTGQLTASYLDLSTGGWTVDGLGLGVNIFRVDDRIVTSSKDHGLAETSEEESDE